MRKAALLVKSFHIIIEYESNNIWAFRVRSTFKNSDTEFKVDEEFKEGNLIQNLNSL
jgi:hypothetical protein